MARKKKSKASEKLDWSQSEGGGGFHIKEGDYLMKLIEVEKEESSTGNDMIVGEFEILDGGKGIKGKTIKSWMSCQPQALFKLRALFEAFGVEEDDFPETVDEAVEKLEELKDEEAEITGCVTDDEYQGRTKSKLDNFLPADGEAEEEEEEKPKKKKGAKEDKKSAKDKKGKKKAIVKYDKDEVKDMDEEALGDLVTEAELEVDLDDFKTLRKKAAAVIAALEENDLIEE